MVATGIASVAVQLVLVREYLAQFQGNEIVIALIFFCWLVYGGIGTALAKTWGTGRRSPSAHKLTLLSLLLIMVGVGQVIAIRRFPGPGLHPWGIGGILPDPGVRCRYQCCPMPCWWGLCSPIA